MLTDSACRLAKPNEKERKISDMGGLYLLVKPSGYKVWRLKYRFAGKEKLLTIGEYPRVGLADARRERERAKDMLADGVDPSVHKAKARLMLVETTEQTFERVARDWHKSRASSWAPRYAEQILSRLVENAFSALGKIPIRQVDAPMVLEVLRKIEARGAREMAHKVRGHVSDVFAYAISSGVADANPAALVAKAMQPKASVLRPAVIHLAHARAVLRKVEQAREAWWATLLSSRLLALTAARPGVVRLAEQDEFEGLDGAEPIWRIPAEKMKLTRSKKRDATFEFLIPLSPQAAQVVKVAKDTSRSSTLLFPGLAWRKPISDNTLSKLYREAGLTGQHVPHGWRATFSTIMNRVAAKKGHVADREIIDLMLAHMAAGIEPIYNRYLYMPRRREIAQAWADMLMHGMPSAQDLIAHARR